MIKLLCLVVFDAKMQNEINLENEGNKTNIHHTKQYNCGKKKNEKDQKKRKEKTNGKRAKKKETFREEFYSEDFFLRLPFSFQLSIG